MNPPPIPRTPGHIQSPEPIYHSEYRWQDNRVVLVGSCFNATAFVGVEDVPPAHNVVGPNGSKATAMLTIFSSASTHCQSFSRSSSSPST